MAYDQSLAARIGAKLEARGVPFVEKKMFGGVAFMVRGNMCVGVIKDEMCMRINVNDLNLPLNSPHIHPFDFTGRPMKAWLVLDHAGTGNEEEMDTWITAALEFISTLPSK